MTDPEPLYCYVHPDRETMLRCNNCERPICSSCAVLTPIGYRCKECVRGQQKAFETAQTADYILTPIVAAGLSLLGSLCHSIVGIFYDLPGTAGRNGYRRSHLARYRQAALKEPLLPGCRRCGIWGFTDGVNNPALLSCRAAVWRFEFIWAAAAGLPCCLPGDGHRFCLLPLGRNQVVTTC